MDTKLKPFIDEFSQRVLTLFKNTSSEDKKYLEIRARLQQFVRGYVKNLDSLNNAAEWIKKPLVSRKSSNLLQSQK